MKYRFALFLWVLSHVAACGGATDKAADTTTASTDTGEPADTTTVGADTEGSADTTTAGADTDGSVDTTTAGAETDEPTDAMTAGTSPKCELRPDGTTWCDNGMLRVRSSEQGITWFDVYHPTEGIWYVNKNNLNLHVGVAGEGFVNTELGQLQAEVTIVSTSETEVIANHRFTFPHGAIVNLELTLKAGTAQATFQASLDAKSALVSGFFWQVSFGQAEAVNELHFDGKDIDVYALPQPFPGGPLEAQHVEHFDPLAEQEFTFSGVETALPDPANPSWMTRVLGLKQHITWHSPMRPGDQFSFEARDVPWQKTWDVPATTPWIEGLWFVRNGSFVDGDRLTYGIDDYDQLN